MSDTYTFKESGVLVQEMTKDSSYLIGGELTTGFIDFGDSAYKKKVYGVSIKIKSASSTSFSALNVSYAINNSSSYTGFSKLISNISASAMGEYEASASLSTTEFVQYDFFPTSKIRCNSISIKIELRNQDMSISEISIHYAPLEKSSYEK